MFGNSTAFESLFDELWRVERGLDQMYGRHSGPAGIRSVARGTFPPINVGATQDEVHVYLFAPGLDAKNFNIFASAKPSLGLGRQETSGQ
jgi:HSP20 family protein